ncbi:MAG: hypothetical protein WC973_03320, partial [Candidatus Dojkabacteria bacterium]
LWCWLGYNQNFEEWTLFREEPKGILVDSEDLIDKVVGNKTPKFEVGKWYRLGKWISKFKEIKNNTEFWAESINTESRFYDKNGYLCLNKYTPKLITDLSEIQQYLPDGHPDKIKEFVLPEKWCIKVQENSCPEVVREWRQALLKYCGDWLDSGYICGDTGYHTGSTKDFPMGYTEITLEQFKKYILKEEKEEAPEKVRKFKLGDTIYLVNDIGKNAPKGSSAKVVGYDDKYVHIEWIDTKSKKQNNGQYYEKDFSLENPMKEKFKIGDWITITGSDINWNSDMDKYIGRTVQITGYRNPEEVTFEDDGGWYWCYEEKHFRRATKEEIASVTKSEESYKVGDYVVITGNNNGSINRIGDIGVIKEVGLSGDYRVQVDGRGTLGNWTKSTDLRKARPDELEDEIETYKDGDWVVVLVAEGTSNADGDVGVVKESNGTSFRVHVPGKTNLSNWTSARNVRKALPHEIPHQDEYICKADPIHTLDEPKSLLDREEIEVIIKKTVPKQFNIF